MSKSEIVISRKNKEAWVAENRIKASLMEVLPLSNRVGNISYFTRRLAVIGFSQDLLPVAAAAWPLTR